MAAGAAFFAGAGAGASPGTWRVAVTVAMPSSSTLKSPVNVSGSSLVATYATIGSSAEISPASIVSTAGWSSTISPCSSSLRLARNARTPGMSTAGSRSSCTRRSTRPWASTAPVTSASGPMTGAAAAAVSAFAPVRIATRVAISSAGSVCSEPSASISSVIDSSMSRQPKSAFWDEPSIASERPRRSSITLSISCARAAIRAKPIVALMPFIEWAMRKISLTVSPSDGSCSMRTSARFRFWRCSRASARNIGR